eukprot:gene3109-3405_t
MITTTTTTTTAAIATTNWKAGLLAALYLFQVTPKGYLNYLPILLREQKTSLKSLASLSLFTLPELLKPIIAILLDFSIFYTPSMKKSFLLMIESSLILVYLFYMRLSTTTSSNSKIELNHIKMLFLLTSFLTALHDTVVDGLAVQILQPSEHAVGALGQYFGYKIGSLLTNGILPVCHGIILTCFLLSYKLFEYALDYLWTSILVDNGINRKVIAQTQFLYGSIAALMGAYLGKELTNYIQNHCHLHPLIAVAICSLWRLLAEIMQIFFVYVTQKEDNSNMMVMNIVNKEDLGGKWKSFLIVHSLLENMSGSALTSVMFSVLLTLSDPSLPTLSYAYLNVIVLIGMQLGKYLTTFASVIGYLPFCWTCWEVYYSIDALISSDQFFSAEMTA